MEILHQAISPWVTEDMDCWTTLTAGRHPELFKKESIVYYQGSMPEHVFIVSSGRVRVTSYHSSGKERQLYIAEQGCLIGEKSAIFHNAHTTTALAIVDSYLYRIPLNVFMDALKNDHELCLATIRMICKRHDILYDALMSSLFSHAFQRISSILINLVAQYGVPIPGGVRIDIRFTHQDVASITGLSRVTVSNTFSLFTNEGIMGRRDGKFEIYDMDRLKAYTVRDD